MEKTAVPGEPGGQQHVSEELGRFKATNDTFAQKRREPPVKRREPPAPKEGSQQALAKKNKNAWEPACDV